jgi:hypothetical protein
VQHGDAADLGAEMARVGGDEAQRLRGGAEQDRVDRRRSPRCSDPWRTRGSLWNAIVPTGAGSVKTTWK